MKKTILLLLLTIAAPTILQAENLPKTLRVMTYNVRNGVGLDNVLNYNRTAQVINNAQADVVAIQELDSITARSAKVDVLRQLAELTSMQATYSKAINHDGGAYGIGILSRTKPHKVRHIQLPGTEERRTLLLADFGDYLFMATHLSLTEADQISSMRIIDSIARTIDKPILLAGDLNFKPKSEPHKALAANFNIISSSKAATYPADKPTECIDYIAFGKQNRFYAEAKECYVVDAPEQSDHRPIVATIEYGEVLRTNPYLQNPTGNGMTVCWQTNAPAYSWVEYGTDTTALKRAHTIVQGQVIANNTNNKIRLSDIQAGQKYYYRIHSRQITYYGPYGKTFGGEYQSPIYEFSLPAGGDYTAIIFNDLHQNRKTIQALMKVIDSKAIKYNYIVYNGDCVDDPDTREEAMATLSFFNDCTRCYSIPSIYTRGNHEIRGAFSMDFGSVVDYPNQGMSYGGFTIGDTRLVLLDSGEDKPDDHWVYYGLNDFDGFRKEQREFLKKELASKEFRKAKSRVLIHHIPIYGQVEGEKNLAAPYWCDLLEKAPFDISINAHTHTFATLKKGEDGNNFPVLIGGGPSMDNATVIVVQSMGGKLSVKCLNTKGDTIYEL